MPSRRFSIVDVFAEEKYAGNQLAVVRDCAGLTTAQMQRIALEMNYSETTFVLTELTLDSTTDELPGGGFHVRIFTPGAEVPFAGHPTLGTAAVIRAHLPEPAPQQIVLNLQVGPIPVTVAGEMLWMQQNEPDFGQTFDPADVAPVLGLEPSQIDPNFPVQDVSTGLPFIICPLRDLDGLRAAATDRKRLSALVADSRAKAILVFCPQPRTPADDLSVRVFVDEFGIPEDPATGSANGCLAGYLARNRYFGGPSVDVRVGQGHEILRPSALYLRATEQDGRVDVQVGGKVIPVAEGVLV